MNDPRSAPPQPGAMAQPVGPPRRGGGARKWAWLIGVAGVMVIGVAAVSVFTVQSMKSGYYVGQEGGKVVLFRGTTQEIPLLDMSEPAKEQPNPPIMVADLPKDKQQRVKDTYPVTGPSKIADLEQIVCRYVLSPERNKVVVIKGKGRQECQPAKAKDSDLVMNDLPESDATAIQEGKRAFVGLPAAEAEIAKLVQRRDQCKTEQTEIKDCPSSGGRS
jgi:protein phosphatase